MRSPIDLLPCALPRLKLGSLDEETDDAQEQVRRARKVSDEARRKALEAENRPLKKFAAEGCPGLAALKIYCEN